MATARFLESMTCYVLPYEVGDGPANMALDQALLEAAAGGDGAVYLRCYGWSVPTLSLGYFQRLAAIRADSRWQGAPMVRRWTGGGAIWHHHDLTYALAVPAGHPQARPSTALYRVVHAAIAALLADQDVPAARRGEIVPPDTIGRNRPVLCFADRDAADIVSRGFKLVGSAQRRRAGAILQQGCVLLARSPRVPELLGVCDVADVPSSPESWSHSLWARIPAALGLAPVTAAVAAEVRVRASELEWSRYRHPAWTESR